MPIKTTFIEEFPSQMDFELLAHYDRAKALKIKKFAKLLRGKKILHINATPRGGGVAELLKSQVPFERSLGLDSHWLYINTDPEFFVITKKIHNLMQGKPGGLTDKEKKIFRAVNKRLALTYSYGDTDVIVVHDPQPAAIVEYLGDSPKKVIRLHIDLSTPNKKTLDFFAGDFLQYDRLIVTQPEFIPEYFPRENVSIITPAINPIHPAHQPMAKDAAKMILEKLGVNPSKPIISQVSRFDPWKDPIGVIDSYYRAKKKIPDLQLVLLGIFLAQDDPEALMYFKRVQKYAKGDHDIHLFSDPKLLDSIENDVLLNSVQSGSDVVLQKSVREGFGMTATEAMWKERPVVGGDTIGIKSQIKNGMNGYIVSTPDEAAKKIVYLLKNKKAAKKLGKAAKKTVEKKFLFNTYLLKHLEVYRDLLAV